jgi:membrane protein YqaA with SNARE-associated domain
MYDWVLKWSGHPRAGLALFLLAAAEASVFPIPPDVLLIAMALAKPGRRYVTAALCTSGSVIGGAIGYLIGFGLWSAVGDWMFRYMGAIGFTPENFDRVQAAYQNNAFLAVFTSGFTPIPFKVFTIAAGVFEIGVPVFLLAALLGRAGRFFLVAELVGRLGPKVLPFIERYLGWLTLAFAALLILGFWALKFAG